MFRHNLSIIQQTAKASSFHSSPFNFVNFQGRLTFHVPSSFESRINGDRLHRRCRKLRQGLLKSLIQCRPVFTVHFFFQIKDITLQFQKQSRTMRIIIRNDRTCYELFIILRHRTWIVEPTGPQILRGRQPRACARVRRTNAVCIKIEKRIKEPKEIELDLERKKFN